MIDNYSNLMIKQIKPDVLSIKGSNTRPFFCLLPEGRLSYKQLEKFVHSKELELAAGCLSRERRLEFFKSRYGLRQVIGHKISPILISKQGAPQWPKGWVGSISHKKGFVVFIIKEETTCFTSLGVDIESFGVTYKVIERISSNYEIFLYQRTIEANSFLSKQFLNTLFFSIKEAIFKCVAPFIKSKQLCLSDCHINEIDFKRNTLRCSVFFGKYSVKHIQGWFQPVYLQGHAPYLLTGCVYEERD